MPETNVYKLLYQGQLAASVSTLATIGSGKSWIIKHFTVINNDSAARTFALYRQGTAASNIITPAQMQVPAGGMVEWDGSMCLTDGETLRGVASVATQLTLTVSGDEVTL